MARSNLALKDLLVLNCKIVPAPGSTGGEDLYILDTSDGRLFMTESHLREIMRAVGQDIATLSRGARVSDNSMISVLHRREPDSGIEHIRLPVKLIEKLTEQQSFTVLRHVEGICADIHEGKLYRDRLEALFEDTANVKIATTREGERVYLISGKLNSSDRRLYMERYAEQVATKTLFDIAKALNGRLMQYVPDEARTKFFIEGNDVSDRKIRYGEEVNTELVLTDEGAAVYTTLADRSPTLRDTIAKVFQQAMLDPFGLSMRHYMGKHNVFKAGKAPLVKVSGFGGFTKWVKGLFASSDS